MSLRLGILGLMLLLVGSIVARAEPAATHHRALAYETALLLERDAPRRPLLTEAELLEINAAIIGVDPVALGQVTSGFVQAEAAGTAPAPFTPRKEARLDTALLHTGVAVTSGNCEFVAFWLATRTARDLTATDFAVLRQEPM